MPRGTSSSERAAARRRNGLSSLTAREQEVLAMLATGARTRVIAEQLGITEPTVKRHLTNIYRKLGVSNRVEAVTRQLGRRGGRRRAG